MDERADVLISVATMNSRERLRVCLESIPGACKRVRWAVIVIDNCSTDGTAQMVMDEFPEVALIVNDRPLGFGSNHNQVLRPLRNDSEGADYVCVLNDDTLLIEGAVDELIACANEDPTLGAVGPLVLRPDGQREPTAHSNSSQLAVIVGTLIGRSAARESPERPDWMNGCCLVLPRRVLADVGVFDEQFFMFSEDVDLTTRVRLSGYRLSVCQKSVIVHYGSGTVSQAPLSDRMKLQMARSYYLYLVKHRGRAIAEAVCAALRAARAVRAIAKIVDGTMRRDPGRLQSGQAEWRLSRYSPRRPVFPAQEGAART